MLGTMTSAFRTRSTRLAAPAVAAVLALTMAACGGGSDKSGDTSPDAQSTAGGSKLVLEGSANLRTNRNRERLAITADGGLHGWHSAWIDEVVSAHEGDQAAD